MKFLLTSAGIKNTSIHEAIRMLNEDEGWAVGVGGILHYTNK